MKKSLQILCICATLAFAACKGNPSTQAGDSTGTGAAGAKVPGNVVADTTKHDSTSIKGDSIKTRTDTLKK